MLGYKYYYDLKDYQKLTCLLLLYIGTLNYEIYSLASRKLLFNGR